MSALTNDEKVRIRDAEDDARAALLQAIGAEAKAGLNSAD
jgi:hypothetical protein